MTACITRAVARGVRMVACASTGNTSSSMAAYAARAGLKALLFVPYKQISAAKLAQALDFGALVVIAVGSEFVSEGAFLIQVADFICRHVWLREAVQVPTPLVAVLREAIANVE